MFYLTALLLLYIMLSCFCSEPFFSLTQHSQRKLKRNGKFPKTLIKHQWPLQLSWFFLWLCECSCGLQTCGSLTHTHFYSGRTVPCSGSDKPVDRVPRWWQTLKALIRSQPEAWEAHTEILLMPHQNMLPKIHEKKDSASGMTGGHSDESFSTYKRKCELTPLFSVCVCMRWRACSDWPVNKNVELSISEILWHIKSLRLLWVREVH